MADDEPGWGTDAQGLVVVAGTVVVDPGDRAAMLEAAVPMMAASQAEDGCMDYVFSAHPTEPDQVLVFERWRDLAALEAHFTTSHMATFASALRGLAISGRDILRYDVARHGPVR